MDPEELTPQQRAIYDEELAREMARREAARKGPEEPLPSWLNGILFLVAVLSFAIWFAFR
jgi:hypothetical protein